MQLTCFCIAFPSEYIMSSLCSPSARVTPCLHALYSVSFHPDNVLFFPALSACAISLHALSTIPLHPYSLLSQPRISSISEVHCMPIPIYQVCIVTLGKVQRITTQSMLLINHVSCRSTTQVQESGGGQTHLTCELPCHRGSKLEIWPIAHQAAGH